MSSSSNLAELRDCQQEPGAVRHQAVTETWPIEARTLLAVLVVAMAIGLLAVGRDWGTPTPKAFTAAPILVLDANSAPPQVMGALPTLGSTLVRRWADARTERPFSSLNDARRRVRGFGPASVAQIGPYLRFDPRPDPPTDDVESPVAGGSKRAWESIQTTDIAGERVDRLIGRR